MTLLLFAANLFEEEVFDPHHALLQEKTPEFAGNVGQAEPELLKLTLCPFSCDLSESGAILVHLCDNVRFVLKAKHLVELAHLGLHKLVHLAPDGDQICARKRHSPEREELYDDVMHCVRN